MTHPFTELRDVLHRDALNENLTPAERINALCELYFMYQNDVHNQAKCIRQIQEINRIESEDGFRRIK